MIHLRRILLPTDFSTFSEASTSYALALAGQFGAVIHVLHVLEQHLSTTPEFGLGLDWPKYVEESQKAAEKKLAQVFDKHSGAKQPVVYATAHGKPFVEILRYAREKEMDLIILSTHGHSGLTHALIGSVAERVVRKAPCPVLTVRPEGHQFVMP